MNILQDLGVIAPMWLVALTGAVVLLLTVTGGHSKPALSSGAHLTTVALAGLATAAWVLFDFGGAQKAFGGAIIVDGLSVVADRFKRAMSAQGDVEF